VAQIETCRQGSATSNINGVGFPSGKTHCLREEFRTWKGSDLKGHKV
jgi:hypothetical protein